MELMLSFEQSRDGLEMVFMTLGHSGPLHCLT